MRDLKFSRSSKFISSSFGLRRRVVLW